ncbi:ribosomal protection-like ABC-F family protein [Planococcus koreensis]|uniref:ribosomal protection-like ABC-F family protein n=1 Tax=Planococcus koreensis TaxID=112331 RepID=UPI0039FC69D5
MAIRGRLSKLSIQYGDRTVLKDIRAEIPEGARIGIVGPNGAGKSSLLKGVAEGGAGVRWLGAEPSIAYMEQENVGLEYAAATIDSRKLEMQWKVPEKRVQLSGGEAIKLRLARTLAQKAEILLLDEPTNHLDAESIQLVTDQLKKYEGTQLIVSHDRYFLDEVATHIWELEAGNLIASEGNYSDSRKAKEHRKLTQQRKYDKQQARIASVEQQISELQSWSGKAHAESTKQDGFKEFYRSKAKRMDVQIRSKRKRLEAELEKEHVEQPEDDAAVKFEISGAAKKGRRVMELKNVEKTFGSRVLFSGVSFTVQHGERVGLVGPNGSGKSTFFRMLMDETEYTGEFWRTESMKVGYLSQDVLDLPEDETPAQLFKTMSFERQGEVRTLMDNLGFGKQHWNEPVRHMSMGERVKLKLMEFMLAQCNVLVLDEPTNHLDLPSREQLEKTLAAFPGTLLIATHDRFFMERLADRLLVFESGKLTKYESGYARWSGKKAEHVESDFLQLETERQAVLGKLSFMKPGGEEYAALDSRFTELTQKIKSLQAPPK